MGLVLGVALFIFQRPFLLLFTSDDAVIHYGQIRIGVMAFVYCVSAFMDNATAAARASEKCSTYHHSGYGLCRIQDYMVAHSVCVF